MRANKYAIIWTAAITALSLVVCLFQYSNHKLIYELSLACFGSALLGIVVAITAYMAERRDAMEQFAEEVRKAIAVIKHIPVIEISDLVYGAIEEENNWLENTTEKRDELKNYIEAYLPIDENTTDKQVSEWIDNRYRSMLEEARRELKRAAAAYIEVGEMDLSGLHSAYGRLDFLFGNETIRKPAYYNLYDRIRNFRLECLDLCRALKPYLSGGGNEIVCLKKMTSLQNKVFAERDGLHYAKLKDDLVHDLETFRGQTYNIEPEYEEPYPISFYIDFRDPKSVDRYLKRNEKAKQGARDEHTKRTSISD